MGSLEAWGPQPCMERAQPGRRLKQLTL